MSVSEEFTERAENAPERLFSVPRSFSSVDTALVMVFRSLSWPVIVVCCACHWTSGARAAVTAAFTAEVTSIPSELEPVAASSSELKSIPLEDDDDEVVPNKEDRADDERPTELIVNLPGRGYCTNETVASPTPATAGKKRYWRSFRID
jgi:hypothetical protein